MPIPNVYYSISGKNLHKSYFVNCISYVCNVQQQRVFLRSRSDVSILCSQMQCFTVCRCAIDVRLQAIIISTKILWHDVVVCRPTFRPLATFLAGRPRFKASRPLTAKFFLASQPAGCEEKLLTHRQICYSPATNTSKRSNTIVVIVIIPVYGKWLLVTM